MPAERWQMYLRYDTTISRDFFRTLDSLMRLQRARQLRKRAAEPLVAAAAGRPVQQVVLYATSSFNATHSLQENAAAANTGAPKLSDSGIRSVSQNSSIVLERNTQKELTRESKEQKTVKRSLPRPAFRSARTLAHLTRNTPDRVARKERRLERLSAAASLLSRTARRTSGGSDRGLDRQ
jgi:hypothetical protein